MSTSRLREIPSRRGRRAMLVGCVACALVLITCGCDGHDHDDHEHDTANEEDMSSGVGELLVTSDNWSLVSPDDDPFAAVRGEPCQDPAAFAVEGTAIELDTEVCGVISVTQPSIVPVDTGDTVVVFITHASLVADEPGEGLVGIALDGEVVWSEPVDIPSNSGVVEGEWVATRDLPVGSEVVFHVDNHGANSWTLVEVRVK